MEPMEQVEVKLLNYTFKFKRMRWQEEFAINFPKDKDPKRVMLAHALLEVSKMKPANVDEALRVMDAIPSAIVTRVFRIWKGSLFPPSRRFTISKLFRAPAPLVHQRQMQRQEDDEDSAHDQLVQNMEAKFGLKEIEETRELNKKILAAAKKPDGGFKGAVVATPDKERV